MLPKKNISLITALVVAVLGITGFADIFTNKATGEAFYGYATTDSQQGITKVVSEDGEKQLKLSEWNIKYDPQGRKDFVTIVEFKGSISATMEMDALAAAIRSAADSGAKLIIFEIDTPGGEVQMTQSFCAKIMDTTGCPIAAYVVKGEYGGALSAGVALCMACDKVYMANGTVIGAATLLSITEHGAKDLKELYGEDIAEKASSSWRSYLATLAESKGRPSIFVKAMVEKNIEIVEIRDGDKRIFTEPANVPPGYTVAKTWSAKDSLVTLTAQEAVNCGVADKIADSRTEILADYNAADANLVFDDSVQKARQELEFATKRLNLLSKRIEDNGNELKLTKRASHAAKLLRNLQTDYKSAIKIAKTYPDLRVESTSLESELSSIEAFYTNLKIEMRQR